jgi:hypothetical protein
MMAIARAMAAINGETGNHPQIVNTIAESL